MEAPTIMFSVLISKVPEDYCVELPRSIHVLKLYCLGIILLVHTDAVEDDSEANVEDEVDDGSKQDVNNHFIIFYAIDDDGDHVKDEENVAESQVYSKQFGVLNSYSVNFQAGKDEIDR